MAMRVRTMVNKFLAHCAASKSPKTEMAYRYQLSKLVSRKGSKIANRLRPIDLTSWAKSWHEVQAVKRLFSWAVKEAGIIRKSPIVYVRLPARKGRRRTLTPTEIARFLRSQRREARLYFLALRESAARPQEIRAATFADLYSEKPGEDIRQALVEGRALIVLYEFKDSDKRTDDDRPRVVLVSKRLGRAVCRRMRYMHDARDHIFINTEGKPWSNNAVRCVMRRARRRLGLHRDARGENVVAYTFRHTAATNLAAAGLLDRTLADLLGHVETKTTARYQHLCVGHLRAALARAQANARPPRAVKNSRKSGRSVPTSKRRSG